MDLQEWHEWRRQGIGGSDAAAIMGVSPWKTQRQLWEEKVFGISSTEDNFAMKSGRENEPKALENFNEFMNTDCQPNWLVHKDVPYLRASLDGINSNRTVVVEIKCPGKDDHLLATQGIVPEKYIPQCQHTLQVVGLNHMYYWSFFKGEGVYIKVLRDEEYIAKLREKEDKFWDGVLNFNPPPLTDKDVIDMEGDASWSLTVHHLKEVKDQLRFYQEEEKNLKAQLIELSKKRNAKGNGAKISKSTCQGHIDYTEAFLDYNKMLRLKYPNIQLPNINFDDYRKDSYEKWRLDYY